MRPIGAFVLLAILAGCAVPGPREADRYFLLDAGAAPGASARATAAVVVAPTTAASFYDTQDIAYSRAPGTRGYYQFNRWTERPQRSLHAQLAARLAGGEPQAAWRLDTHLEEIYHDAAQSPGTARITVRAVLLEAATRKVVARRTFTRSAPAASYDAPGAVQGFNQALAAILGDIEAWVAAETRAK